jgi:hypothetical protein
MSLGLYQGQLLTPGMGTELFTADTDNAAILYGGSGLYTPIYLTYAVVSGAARDAGNTPTDVLRPGCIMGIITASGKWAQFTSGASDGTQYARGILTALGLSTQQDGSNADKFLATILVGGIVNPEALCLASTAGYGLPRTSVGLAVRKHFLYAIRMSDDWMNDLTVPLSGR